MSRQETIPLWTDEHIETLRRLWPTYTASEITAVLNTSQARHTYTRCAVLGKAFRLGLPKKALPPTRSKKHKAKRVPEPKPLRPVKRDIVHPEPITLPKSPPVPPMARNISIMELTSTTCRWPIGEPDEFMRYCGCECEKDVTESYCAHHMAVAYMAPVDRATRAAADSLLRRFAPGAGS